MQVHNGKPPRSGRLARTGVELSRDARVRLAWMDFYRRCRNVARTGRHFRISRQTFYRWQRRYDPYDFDHAGGAQSLSSSTTPADLDCSLRRKGFDFAVAVSALGQGQAGGSSASPAVAGFGVHGRTYSQQSEATRPAGGTSAHGRSRIAPCATAPSVRGAQTQAVRGV